MEIAFSGLKCTTAISSQTISNPPAGRCIKLQFRLRLPTPVLAAIPTCASKERLSRSSKNFTRQALRATHRHSDEPMMLAPELHDPFGPLECSFEAAPGQAVNAYTLQVFNPASFVLSAPHILRIKNKADIRCAKLLALHRPCCLMRRRTCCTTRRVLLRKSS